MWLKNRQRNIGGQIESAHRDMPKEIYHQWLKGFLSSLSQKEVKRLKSGMPALIQVDG
jgi:thiaminase